MRGWNVYNTLLYIFFYFLISFSLFLFYFPSPFLSTISFLSFPLSFSLLILIHPRAHGQEKVEMDRW
jgi:hypothetical protein